MPSAKYEGLSYPTHCLKIRGSGIRNYFLECRIKYFYTLLTTDEKNILNRHVFRASVVTQFIVKVYIKKIRKKSHF